MINITTMNTKSFCGGCRNANVAAALGHLDCLKKAHLNGCKWNEQVCAFAAEYGQLECLVYAHTNGCPWDTRTCKWAAYNGRLECLEYAHANGCRWDEDTCAYAAEYGHLDCLVYAHTNRCPWDEETCANAALNGHLECLVYAHENGCPCIHNTGKLEIYSTELDATTDNEDIQCGICYTNCTRVEFKPCNHKLCIACSNTTITQNPQKKCPFCRGNVKENLLLVN